MLKAKKIVLAMEDIILFCDWDAQERVLRTKPSASFDAGDRTMELPPTISLDYPIFGGKP